MQVLTLPCYPIESKDDAPETPRVFGGIFEGLRTLVRGVHPGKALSGKEIAPVKPTPKIEN